MAKGSKLYKKEYQREKRMKELGKRGYNTFNVRYMMGYKDVSEKQASKAMKNENIVLDGKL